MGYPRCADKPKHHFLKKGARYVLLGSSSTPEKQEDPLIWANDPEAMMLRLEKKQSSKQVRLLQKKINNNKEKNRKKINNNKKKNKKKIDNNKKKNNKKKNNKKKNNKKK